MTEIPTRSIAQLPIATSVNGNDKLVISQGGITKTANASQIRQITSSLSIVDDLFVGRDAYVSGTTQTGLLKVLSTASVASDAYVSGKVFAGAINVTGAISAASGNFTGNTKTDGNATFLGAVSVNGSIYTNTDAYVSGKVFAGAAAITGVLSVANGANIDNITTLATVMFTPVSEGSAAPTAPGQLRFMQTTASVTGTNGIEYLSSTFGSGYGFNLKCIDDGGGVATVFGFAKRRNNVAWSLAGYYDDLGNFVWSSGTALATNADRGFLYIPSCSGVPTGVPTVRTGAVPIVMDIVNSKLYAYRAGAWASVSLA